MENKKNPLISILVPVFNIERYIGICLESIIRQTYKNLEIIVVDDGSTDRSGEICDLYAQKDSRIKVIHKENGGLVSARKAAIKLAYGDYIGYVDGDDWIENDFYSSLISEIIHSNSDVVIAGFSRDLFNSSTQITSVIPAGIYENGSLDYLFSNMISTGDFFRHGITTYLWNKLFKKSIIENCQLTLDEQISIGEDAAVVYPALLSCRKISIVDICSYHYRQREDSMLKKSVSFSYEKDRLRVLYVYMSECLKSFPNKYALENQIQKYILTTTIIRSGGIYDSAKINMSYIPFGENINDKDIVICGAGTFGQQLEKRLRESKCCNIVAWVDDDYWEYRRCCINVDSISVLSEIHFDYVLIGTIDSFAAQSIRSRLIDIGVSVRKILNVVCPKDGIENILEEYLKND